MSDPTSHARLLLKSLVLLCAVFDNCSAFAQAPQEKWRDGIYLMAGGWGSLEISPKSDGPQRFEIYAQGANQHTCELSGVVKGREGMVGVGADPKEVCKISFERLGTAVRVTPQSDSCQDWCGARAGFDGVYQRPSAVCLPSRRSRTIDAARARAAAGRHRIAHDMLASLTFSCGKFFNWLERDLIRLQQAQIQLDLGHAASCRKTLNQTMLLSKAQKIDVSKLPPADRDNYMPIAEAIEALASKCNRHR